MRAITLTQPWAGLVAAGLKLIENRGRAMINPRNFGEPIALHASREFKPEIYQRIDQIWPRCGLYMGDNDATCPQLTCQRRVGHGGLCDNHHGEDDDQDWLRLSRMTKAILATVVIERAVTARPRTVTMFNRTPNDGWLVYDLHTSEAVDLGDQRRWFFGEVGYVISHVHTLQRPVVGVDGSRGLWTLSPELAQRVLAQ